MIFRAMWPIRDFLAFDMLCAQATGDLPLLMGQAKARPTASGKFSVAPSAEVPGSGRVTEWVLLYHCPAVRIADRAYHKAPTQAAA